MPEASINPLAPTSRLDLKGPFASGTSPATRSTRVTPASPRARARKSSSISRDGILARGDMRHRIEAGAAERRGGVDIVAVIVAGQEGDRDVDPRRKMIRQLLQPMRARGDLDRGRGQQVAEVTRGARLGFAQEFPPCRITRTADLKSLHRGPRKSVTARDEFKSMDSHCRSRRCEEPTGPAKGRPDDKLRDEVIHSSFVRQDGFLRFARNDDKHWLNLNSSRFSGGAK